MMIDINDYMLLSKEKRQEHLKLNEPCIDRGSKTILMTSAYCRGLLAHILDTSYPNGRKILCCHACNNGKCSNPNHLYWGWSSENIADAVACGARLPLNEYRKLKKQRSASIRADAMVF